MFRKSSWRSFQTFMLLNVLNLFLQKLLEDKLREEQIVEWYNLHGKKLARAIYICILDNKFPKEISQLIGFDPAPR